MLAAAWDAEPAVMTHKADTLEDFRTGLKAVLGGGSYYSPRVHQARRVRKQGGGEQPLAREEIEMLKLIAMGQSTKEAAAILEISHKTADNRRSAIMGKLDLHCTAALTRYAMRCGLVEP
jgi:DNA-binding NarL/FixJ family response regulator